MRREVRGLVVLLAASAACLGTEVLRGSEASVAVRHQVEKLNDWLDTVAGGDVWRTHLDLPRLREELAKDQGQDQAFLLETAAKLKGKSPALSRLHFTQVREALDKYLADAPARDPAELKKQLAEAGSLYRAATPEDVTGAKARLQAAFDRLNRLIGGPGESRQAWRNLLAWEDIQAELASTEKPDLPFLKQVALLFDRPDTTLNRSEFADFQKALQDYAVAARGAYDEGAKSEFEAATAKLAALVSKATSGKALSRGERAELATALGRLAADRQIPHLVAAARGFVQRPNLYVQATDDLATAGMNRSVDERRPVTDNILGTSISAQAHSVGTVRGHLVPSEEAVVFQSNYAGTTYSQNYGVNGPATINSSSVTQLTGSKQFQFNELGWLMFRTRSNATSSTTIHNINVNHRFQERAQATAWSQANANKPESERIAAQHAEQRFNEQFDRGVNEQLAESHANFKKNKESMTRRDQFPQLRFRTTPDNVFITALHAQVDQLGADCDPPALEGDPSLGLRAHETGIMNFAATRLGQTTLTKEEWDKMSKDNNLSNSKPEEDEEERTASWEIKFPVRPVTLVMNDGGLRVTVHALSFTRRDREFDTPMDVTADYKLSLDAEGRLIADRQGPLVIQPPDFEKAKRQLTATETGAKPLLNRTFEKVFEPQIIRDGIKLGGRLKHVGTLKWTQLKAQKDGWLLMAWEPRDPKALKATVAR